MKDQNHASPRSVTEAHRNSNIVILRFAPSLSRKKGSCTTHPLGMTVTIVRMGPGSLAEA
ncbi:MAG: hypothetical protein ACMUHM_03250 [Thermoplasmatota archaeon]